MTGFVVTGAEYEVGVDAVCGMGARRVRGR
jgi:hypothetical protein